jgi:hypothetical protein
MEDNEMTTQTTSLAALVINLARANLLVQTKDEDITGGCSGEVVRQMIDGVIEVMAPMAGLTPEMAYDRSVGRTA